MSLFTRSSVSCPSSLAAPPSSPLKALETVTPGRAKKGEQAGKGKRRGTGAGRGGWQLCPTLGHQHPYWRHQDKTAGRPVGAPRGRTMRGDADHSTCSRAGAVLPLKRPRVRTQGLGLGTEGPASIPQPRPAARTRVAGGRPGSLSIGQGFSEGRRTRPEARRAQEARLHPTRRATMWPPEKHISLLREVSLVRIKEVEAIWFLEHRYHF